jgi:acetylornithine/LysW-gamma-L-lysine aminotransferase
MSTIEIERVHSSGVYPKLDIQVVRGLGARVWDATGREYIDCMAGWGVAIVGHCHPEVVAAIQAQAARLITCPESFYNDRRAEVMASLVEIAPEGLSRCFLCNSGTESIEGAIKFARLATGRPGIIATINAFHGRTLGSLSATWRPKFREPFEPLVPGFSFVQFDNLDAMAQVVNEKTAAVLLEVVQGEGGVRPCSSGYLKGLQEICHEHGALLILDEVQTGMGRTGRMFACEHYGVAPDVLCLGKGMAGGVPMGAVLLGPRIPKLPTGVHASTFGGNPLACAAAVATIGALRGQDLPGRAARLGAWLLDELRKLSSPKIRHVRGLGLMVGIELQDEAQPYVLALRERGVLAMTAGPTVLRLLPPLVIEQSDLERAVSVLGEVLAH